MNQHLIIIKFKAMSNIVKKIQYKDEDYEIEKTPKRRKYRKIKLNVLIWIPRESKKWLEGILQKDKAFLAFPGIFISATPPFPTFLRLTNKRMSFLSPKDPKCWGKSRNL